MSTGIRNRRKVSKTAAGGQWVSTQGDVIVTTIQAPTGLRADLASRQQSFIRRSMVCALVGAASIGLAGCESSNALFGSNASSPEAQLAAPAAQSAQQQPLAKVAIAPVIGAPDQMARQIQQEFSSAVAQQRANVVSSGERADFTLRGYIVAAKDRAGTKVSYIWDVTDTTGKRINRITGEEVVAGASPKDPWTAVTPQIVQSIAQKSASSFGAWLPTASSQAAIAAAPGTQPVGVGAPAANTGVQTASTAAGAASSGVASARPVATVAAYAPNDVAALVPSVSGAPGDGATALTQAIQGELTRNGIALASQSSAQAYRVEGVVKMGQARDGKQPIQIDWNVKDPQGKRLGTVSQKNEIPEGSLDGPWGKTADAAAAAAAQGILKLLPQRTASN
jgi:hypothetical protein